MDLAHSRSPSPRAHVRLSSFDTLPIILFSRNKKIKIFGVDEREKSSTVEFIEFTEVVEKKHFL